MCMTAVDGGNLPCYLVGTHKVLVSELVKTKVCGAMPGGGKQEGRLPGW